MFKTLTDPPVCSVCGEKLEGVNLMAPAIHRETSEPCCGTQCSNRPSIRTFDPATGEFSRFYRRYHDQDGNRLGASDDGLPFYSPSYTKENTHG